LAEEKSKTTLVVGYSMKRVAMPEKVRPEG